MNRKAILFIAVIGIGTSLASFNSFAAPTRLSHSKSTRTSDTVVLPETSPEPMNILPSDEQLEQSARETLRSCSQDGITALLNSPFDSNDIFTFPAALKQLLNNHERLNRPNNMLNLGIRNAYLAIQRVRALLYLGAQSKEHQEAQIAKLESMQQALYNIIDKIEYQ